MLDVGRLLRVAHRLLPQVVVDESVVPAAEQVMRTPPVSYPALHVGSHEEPAARVLEHVPRAPLVGAVTAHGVYVGAGVGVDVGAGVGATVLGMSEP